MGYKNRIFSYAQLFVFDNYHKKNFILNKKMKNKFKKKLKNILKLDFLYFKSLEK